MKSKCVLITGTTNGIGKNLQKIYLESNYKVISINRKNSKINKLPSLYNFNIDICNESEVIDLFNELNKLKLFPDIFIFNAGINKIDFKKNFDFKSFNENISINFLSITFFCNLINTKYTSKKTIIFISSFSTIFYNKNNLGYYISKKLLNRYFETISLEYPLNYYKLVALGPVNTKIKRYMDDEKKINKLVFSLLAIDSLKAAKKIYKFSYNKNKKLNYPFKIYLFYRICGLLKSIFKI